MNNFFQQSKRKGKEPMALVHRRFFSNVLKLSTSFPPRKREG